MKSPPKTISSPLTSSPPLLSENPLSRPSLLLPSWNRPQLPPKSLIQQQSQSRSPLSSLRLLSRSLAQNQSFQQAMLPARLSVRMVSAQLVLAPCLLSLQHAPMTSFLAIYRILVATARKPTVTTKPKFIPSDDTASPTPFGPGMLKKTPPQQAATPVNDEKVDHHI